MKSSSHVQRITQLHHKGADKEKSDGFKVGVDPLETKGQRQHVNAVCNMSADTQDGRRRKIKYRSVIYGDICKRRY
jgi:hypothetical protein